jgi:hypothetical protein
MDWYNQVASILHCLDHSHCEIYYKPRLIKEVSVYGKPVGMGTENYACIKCADPIPGMPEATFLLDTSVVEEEERPDLLNNFRKKIEDAFYCIWGDPVQAVFDFEWEAAECEYCKDRED